jgi:hypothetical protein
MAAGFKLGHITEDLLKHGAAAEHWRAQMEAAGAGQATIASNVAAAWSNAGTNMNTTFTDSLKNIIELNKVTGDWVESTKLLPAFSIAEAGMRSVKAEGLHDSFRSGTQTLNFARGLEELGTTQRGANEEERRVNTEHTAHELLRTMISTRGLFDGNALYAMTNNSGGVAQNWDEKMATTVAPILADIMKPGKFGNADYMAVRTFKGGTITGKAVEQLAKYGIITVGDGKDKDAYVDKNGYHLRPNSKFAEGIDTNIWDWTGRILEKLKKNGYDIANQKVMNEYVTATSSNKSTGMLMRALMEPLVRLQIQKEMALRDKVPDDAAGILQKDDPVLKIQALHSKFDDLFTVLGGPLVGPAMYGLDQITQSVSWLAQKFAAHPDLATWTSRGTAGVAAGAVIAGGAMITKTAWDMMRGGFGLPAAAVELSGAAAALDAAAVRLGGASAISGGVKAAAGGAVAAETAGGVAVAQTAVEPLLSYAAPLALAAVIGYSAYQGSGIGKSDQQRQLLKDIDDAKAKMDVLDHLISSEAAKVPHDQPDDMTPKSARLVELEGKRDAVAQAMERLKGDLANAANDVGQGAARQLATGFNVSGFNTTGQKAGDLTIGGFGAAGFGPAGQAAGQSLLSGFGAVLNSFKPRGFEGAVKGGGSPTGPQKASLNPEEGGGVIWHGGIQKASWDPGVGYNGVAHNQTADASPVPQTSYVPQKAYWNTDGAAIGHAPVATPAPQTSYVPPPPKAEKKGEQWVMLDGQGGQTC